MKEFPIQVINVCFGAAFCMYTTIIHLHINERFENITLSGIIVFQFSGEGLRGP